MTKGITKPINATFEASRLIMIGLALAMGAATKAAIATGGVIADRTPK
jgi:hypothetical protein